MDLPTGSVVARALSQVLQLVTYFGHAELLQTQFGVLKKQIHALASMGKAVLLDPWQGWLIPSGRGTKAAGGVSSFHMSRFQGHPSAKASGFCTLFPA